MIEVFEPTDILLTDVCAQDLHNVISKKLNAKYLSDTAQEYDGDIEGIIHGHLVRLFCSTTIKIKSKIKIVHFLVDTGSFMTFLSEEVINAFGLFIQNTDNLISVKINNKQALVAISPPSSRHSQINILGMGFLKGADAELFIEYWNNSFTLKFNKGDE
ncbi:hypothetical protein RclHR1_01650020 [Rhizophagus clarus]|uniref:Peptidase A2 domain-containing protein n=1 Tax=Rhizophagus clarus TaxID=94130 RepID=A0A2Z6QHR3_9GLOM|nr:hypothetical protein RclHR1_01650020 [Rhizophagus clarus]GES73277.1 hypothetical protein GLOIN_2v1471333 [Rhizophagus clarus]GES73278.1 hypothetical protein GLOIN_2v1471333 [Rhizophagus clarus]